jgi:DNA invertase Pin-like site-specific DNA recombinase
MSTAEVSNLLAKFKAAGVAVKSHQESWLDTEGPVGDLLTAVFAWVGAFERARLVDRIRAAMRRAQKHCTKNGNPIGRPTHSLDAERAGHAMKLANGNLSKAAKIARVSRPTIARRLAS